MENLEWIKEGACLPFSPDIFLPEPDDKGAERLAKRICAECIVKSECLSYALDNHIKVGIYGGTSPKERRNINRERQRGKSTL
jgi:WhiB family redox-sensing transcriptional regulator